MAVNQLRYALSSVEKADEKDKLAGDLDQSLSRSANTILSGSRGCPKRPVNHRKQATSTSMDSTWRGANSNTSAREAKTVTEWPDSRQTWVLLCLIQLLLDRLYLCITMSSQNRAVHHSKIRVTEDARTSQRRDHSWVTARTAYQLSN